MYDIKEIAEAVKKAVAEFEENKDSILKFPVGSHIQLLSSGISE